MSDLAWLESVGFFDMKLGLDRMRELADRLGTPQKRLKFIHVAGSNGKGSVCTFIENGLRACGYKTGFYSSPHLARLEERFRINEKTVEEEAFTKAADRVRNVVEAMRKEQNGPTYFEITTAIALALFEMEQVDFAIWEVGLGGRLDATNIITPELSIITGISLEHTEHLGPTLAAIAGEKAGIIKEGVPVICGPLRKEAFDVIAAKAEALHAPLTAVEPYSDPVRILRNADGKASQLLTLEGSFVEIPLPGVYQRNNAKVAAAALSQLSARFGFDRQTALGGLRYAEWPARMQYIPERRLIIDGAHNPEGAEALAASLKEFYPDRKFHFLCGCFADKNANEVLRFFAPLALDFQFIEFDGSGRKIRTAEELSDLLRTLAPGCPSGQAELEPSLESLPAPDGELTVLSGSLHMCGEALHFLNLL